MPKTFLLAIALVLVAPLACLAVDQCAEAYRNGKDTENLSQCRTKAESGNAEAEFGYALILWSGHDQKNDQREALMWFQKSARQGHKLAQVALGTFLSHEKADQSFRDRPEAYAWFVTAGETDAATRLLSQLTSDEIQKAKALAKDYETKYRR